MDEFSSLNQASSYTGQHRDRKKKHPMFKTRVELKLMIAALDGISQVFVKEPKMGNTYTRTLKLRFTPDLGVTFLFLANEIVRKITHYQI